MKQWILGLMKAICVLHMQAFVNIIKQFIGASLSEPHTGQMASPVIYDLSIVHHSINKCPMF